MYKSEFSETYKFNYVKITMINNYRVKINLLLVSVRKHSSGCGSGRRNRWFRTNVAFIIHLLAVASNVR